MIAPFYLIQTLDTNGAELFEEQHGLSFDEAVKEIEGSDNLKGVRVLYIDLGRSYCTDATEGFAWLISAKSFREWERPHYAVREWLDALGIEYCEATPHRSFVDFMLRQHGTLNRQQQL